jgi:hypothetical protein
MRTSVRHRTLLASGAIRSALPVCIGLACWMCFGSRTQAQSCDDCTPSPVAGWAGLAPGEWNVCFQSDATHTIPSWQVNAMSIGIEDYYGHNGYFYNNNIGITFNYTTGDASNPCSGDINVTVSDSLPSNEMVVSDGGNYSMQINSQYLGQYDEGTWEWTGAHEMSHLMGYDDVHIAGCEGFTILYGNGAQSSLPGSMLCSDSRWLANRYPANPSYVQGEWDNSTHEEDCWDWVLMHYEFCNRADGSWYLCDEWGDYQYTDCSPPY